MTVRVALPFAVVAAALAPRQADAFRPDAEPGAAARAESESGASLRSHREVAWDRAPPQAREAWREFQREGGGAWRASWDVATRVPSRIVGAGLPAPGTVDSAAAAERAAREFLEDHIDLLAPGSDPDDFELATNHKDGDLRSVGLLQHYDGLPVVGGQVSFRFRNDRLFAIGSEALPDVALEDAASPLSPAAARRAATSAPTDARPPSGAREAAAAGEVAGPVIFPLVGEREIHGYRAAKRVDVAGRAPGDRWDVYVDASTGEVLARERRAHRSATLSFDAPVRRPGAAREDYPARFASVRVDGARESTDEEGVVPWPGGDDAHIAARPEGRYVNMVNHAAPLAEHARTVESGDELLWDASEQERVDAQLTAFTHTQIAADRAVDLTGGAPWIDEQVDVNVNLDATCNAFFDQHDKSINFFLASEDCANTGRLPDVIYHEYGHLLHVESILEGVGQFDAAFSEGAADYFAALITGDPGVGRGFFHNDEALRHLAPEGEPPRTWPEDIAGIHRTGLIFGGAMWRLREGLIDAHGEEEGGAIADELFYAALRRATDIPSSYIEILIADDEDGDLTTGTPNICEINRAFGAHGLRPLRGEVDDPGAVPISSEGHEVGFRIHGIYDQCESDAIASAEVVWKERGAEQEHRAPAEPAGEGGRFAGVIPPQERDTALRYRFEITFADGGSLELPRNPADPMFELYVGDLVPIYCNDFEDAPFGSGWSRGARRGLNDWEWGAPSGVGRDPPFAYSGANVLATDLGRDGSDGTYTPESVSFVRSPTLHVGDFTNVRLQYRRWLTVRDGYFDTASIRANGEVMWANKNSREGPTSSTHHLDGGWRFHDVPLTSVMGTDTVELTFEIDSGDAGPLGGWNVDQLCILVDPDAVCGDGVAAGFAACDDGDGNSDVLPDACRTDCRPARCGDGVVNSEEECDPAAEDGPPCRHDCQLVRGTGGCAGCRAGDGAGAVAGPILLAFLFSLVISTRRRRASR